MSERHRCEARQQLGMLRLVPVRRELIGCADVDRSAIDRKRLRWFEPRAERLVGQLLARALQQARPGFLRGEGHSACGKLERGSEARPAGLKLQSAQRLREAPARYAARSSLNDVSAPDRFTGLPRNKFHRISEYPWASPHIVPVTSDASGRTDSAHAWPRDGDAKFSAADGRKGASASRCSSLRSTPASDSSSSSGGDRRKFPRRHRLTRGAELDAAARRGKRLRLTCLEARLLAVESGESRIGLVVPKHGQSAVRRNRLKRRLREYARLSLLPVLKESTETRPMDIVVRARPQAYGATATALRGELDTMMASIVRLASKRG